MRTWARPVACVVLVCLAVGIGVAPVGAALPPTTMITLSPPTPSGVPPWYLAAPEVFVTSSQDGTVTYAWSGQPEATTPVSASVPVSVGFAPSGVHQLSAFAVSAAGTETPPASRTVYTDALVPGRPSPVVVDTSDTGVELSWAPAEDNGASGVVGYSVYRSAEGAPFEPGDLLASTSSTQFADSQDLAGALMWYAVATRDAAGNRSLLSDPVRAGRPVRMSGRDRYSTALAVSRAAFAPGSVPTVVIASGRDFPDALTASGLAGVLRSPVLLVGASGVTQALKNELSRLGAVDAYVVGGPATIARTTLQSLDVALPGSTTRLWGPDRYATARSVARRIALLRGTPAPRAYVVSGTTFPDALSVAPAAYAEGAPVVFAKPDAIPSSTLAAIFESGAPRTLIAGSRRSVWGGVETRVPSPLRVSGVDRFATSRAVADWAAHEDVLSGDALVLATGWDFPDGLAASSFAGERSSPLVLLGASGFPAMRSWLTSDAERFGSIHIVGGETAIATSLVESINAALTIQ